MPVDYHKPDDPDYRRHPDYMEMLKRNLLREVRHHRETCKGEECDITLHFLRDVGELAGFEFTQNEKDLFF